MKSEVTKYEIEQWKLFAELIKKDDPKTYKFVKKLLCSISVEVKTKRQDGTITTRQIVKTGDANKVRRLLRKYKVKQENARQSLHNLFTGEVKYADHMDYPELVLGCQWANRQEGDTVAYIAQKDGTVFNIPRSMVTIDAKGNATVEQDVEANDGRYIQWLQEYDYQVVAADFRQRFGGHVVNGIKVYIQKDKHLIDDLRYKVLENALNGIQNGEAKIKGMWIGAWIKGVAANQASNCLRWLNAKTKPERRIHLRNPYPYSYDGIPDPVPEKLGDQLANMFNEEVPLSLFGINDKNDEWAHGYQDEETIRKEIENAIRSVRRGKARDVLWAMWHHVDEYEVVPTKKWLAYAAGTSRKTVTNAMGYIKDDFKNRPEIDAIWQQMVRDGSKGKRYLEMQRKPRKGPMPTLSQQDEDGDQGGAFNMRTAKVLAKSLGSKRQTFKDYFKRD